MLLSLIPPVLSVAVAFDGPVEPPVVDFDVPVQVDRISQAEVDRAMRGSIRGRNQVLSRNPGVTLVGPSPRIGDTPLGEVVQYIDGVRVSGY